MLQKSTGYISSAPVGKSDFHRKPAGNGLGSNSFAGKASRAAIPARPEIRYAGANPCSVLPGPSPGDACVPYSLVEGRPLAMYRGTMPGTGQRRENGISGITVNRTWSDIPGGGHPHIDRRSLEMAKLVVARIDEKPDLAEVGRKNFERWKARQGECWRDAVRNGKSCASGRGPRCEPSSSMNRTKGSG